MRRRVAGVGVVVVGSIGCLMAGLFAGATSPTCDAPRPTMLSLHEMGSVKKRVDAHVRQPETPLVLAGPEASFLLADYIGLPVTLDVRDGFVDAIVSRPSSLGRCLNVSFLGSVAIDAGTANLVPTVISVGSFDLSWLLSGKEWVVVPRRISHERAARLLSLTTSLELGVDELVVTVDDPWSLR